MAIGVLCRLLPHVPNVAPVTAIALFSAAYIGIRYSVVIPIATMLVSDFFIGFYQWQIILVVYATFVCIVCIGWYVNKRVSITSIFISSLGSSVIFFLSTNWAVWQFGSMYPYSFDGLLQSYEMAIPFLKNTLTGDMVYTFMFFGIFEFSKRVVFKTRQHLLYW